MSATINTASMHCIWCPYSWIHIDFWSVWRSSMNCVCVRCFFFFFAWKQVDWIQCVGLLVCLLLFTVVWAASASSMGNIRVELLFYFARVSTLACKIQIKGIYVVALWKSWNDTLNNNNNKIKMAKFGIVHWFVDLQITSARTHFFQCGQGFSLLNLVRNGKSKGTTWMKKKRETKQFFMYAKRLERHFFFLSLVSLQKEQWSFTILIFGWPSENQWEFFISKFWFRTNEICQA